jgi:predicted ABC-type ATPase
MVKENHKPVLIVIAGPNGSGKTTISEGKVDFIRRAHEAGYFIRIFFVSTSHHHLEIIS